MGDLPPAHAMIFTERGVILSEAKNPEGDGGVDAAAILWILHSAALRSE